MILDRFEKKTLLIIFGILCCLIAAVIYGLHILGPALDPISWDMIKIFLCGLICGILIGLWTGRKIERYIRKREDERKERESNNVKS